MTDKEIVKKTKNNVYTIEELYKTPFAIFIVAMPFTTLVFANYYVNLSQK